MAGPHLLPIQKCPPRARAGAPPRFSPARPGPREIGSIRATPNISRSATSCQNAPAIAVAPPPGTTKRTVMASGPLDAESVYHQAGRDLQNRVGPEKTEFSKPRPVSLSAKNSLNCGTPARWPGWCDRCRR